MHGRGRMQRKWLSGLGTGLTFSLKWTFPSTVVNLPSLSLLISLAVIRALRRCAPVDIKVKWPNDVICGSKKLAGILIEGRHDAATGAFVAIIGIGINFKLPNEIKLGIAKEATDLYEMTGQMLDRNLILGVLLDELIDILKRFEVSGFAPFKIEWINHHAYQGKSVKLLMPNDEEVFGTITGINDDGSLCLQTTAGIRSFSVGEISLWDLQ